MINEYNVGRFCREDPRLMENYSLAIADTENTWVCHHRRESIYTADGLKEIGEYYYRPACELIFLPPEVHSRLYHAGRSSLAAKTKRSETMTRWHRTKNTDWNIGESRKTPVHAFKDGVLAGTFSSQTEAAEKLCLHKKLINDVLKGRRPHTRGYTFEYAS